jgi:hypothetical protein
MERKGGTGFSWRSVLLTLMPFLSVPVLGWFFYFRHDDSAWLIWAKNFSGSFWNMFHPDPAVNGMAGLPMDVYHRPFANVYIKSVWSLFKTRPEPYWVVAGVAFMAAVYVLYRWVERYAGRPQAVTAGLVLFAAFNGTMYNLFHIGVPVMFFAQICMIYFFWSYLQRPGWVSLAGMLVFIGFATTRQTTPVILAALLLVWLIQKPWKEGRFTRRIVPPVLVLIGGWVLVFLSTLTSQGSILSVFPDIGGMVAFFYERFHFYGSLLVRGIPGLILLFLFTGGVLQRVQAVLNRHRGIKRHWIWPGPALLLTVVFLLLPVAAVFWLALCILVLFVWDEELRPPLAWAGASLLTFISVTYYHDGYLLEAGFPLAASMGILAVRLVRPALSRMEEKGIAWQGLFGWTAAGLMILGFLTLGILGGRTPVLGQKIRVLQIAVDSNRNFRDLMAFMQNEMPAGAIVYELSEESLNTTYTERRFFSMEERAARIKVMNIEDKRMMLDVLDREDLALEPAPQTGEATPEPPAYLIALNRFEMKEAESVYSLQTVKKFHRKHDTACVYRFFREDSLPE